MFCQGCGVAHDNLAKFCPDCGGALQPVAVKPEPVVQPERVVKPAPARQAVSNSAETPEDFYRAIVGPKNQNYYLSSFERFEAMGKAGASWNWPAFFLTFYWFLYRKMWLNAFLYFLLPYVVMVPFGIVAALAGGASDTIVSIGYLTYFVGIFVLPPMYANALYYKHCKKKIAEAKATSQDRQRQIGVLYGKGGTSGAVLIIVLIFVFVAIIGILAAIAIPQYHEYTMRAQMAEALSAGRTAADSVTDYYNRHQDVPDTLSQAGFTGSIPSSVQNLDLNAQNGTIIITMAKSPLVGKTLLLVPTLDANKQIVWTCMSKDIKEGSLPSTCRQNQ